MSDYTVSIPENLYDKVKQIAERNARSVDDVIRVRLEESLDEPLNELPEDERRELHALMYLSDDALWTIAREQIGSIKQTRLQTLMDRNSSGTITPDEYHELEQLVEQGQRLTLRKAEAMKHLLKRGYVVTLEDLKPAE